jgi:hypothetical protein
LEEFFGNTLSKSGVNLPTYIEVWQLILVFLCSVFTFLHVWMRHVDFFLSLYISIRYSHIIVLKTILCPYDL